MQQHLTSHCDIDECVEIFGLREWDSYYLCLQHLCKTLQLDINQMENYTVKGNGLLVKLVDENAVNEWERKSREKRITLKDLKDVGQAGDNKIKVFAAAPAKYKLLLHTVRKTLPNFKYIWIGKRGVLARHKSRSQIHVIKNENDINYVKNLYCAHGINIGE
ncbi:fp25k [Matsumuraeses phaseoli granulovirus]|uniref:Fp25k n=1 Tax=Matsumuraeses phaseoli granulovirus TaxID=2760664 RepID=A0AAE7MLH7_9BBAC|nr:fp25k [Matsumuraeses phaseoli granulovirus]QOD40070.1 fp25k [Matsumuraeses phaseoli granulovirus]